MDIDQVYSDLECRIVFNALQIAGANDATERRQPTPTLRSDSQPSLSTVDTSAIILGARRGGIHILETLHARGVTIAGIYDQSDSAPGIAKARQLGISIYSGSWAQLAKLLYTCSNQNSISQFVFVPTRNRKFIQFADRTLAHARAMGFRNFTVLRMDTHFSDYEPANNLCSLMGINP